MAQIGPIVYDAEWVKDNVTWKENTVDYGMKKIYTFNEKESAVSEDTYITVLNLPWMSALTKLKYGTGMSIQKKFIFGNLKKSNFTKKNSRIQFRVYHSGPENLKRSRPKKTREIK